MIYYLFCIFIITILSMTLHELAHGYVAYWQGDETAKRSGRLSLNPLKHLDPMMSVVVPLALALMGMPVFGGAKPVPINTRNLKHGEWSFALVAIAGPLMNFILAFISFVIYYFTQWDFFGYAISVNIGFMLFNIIPIPPLDGSRVVYALAPNAVRRMMEAIERYGIVLVYALIMIFGTVLDRYMNDGAYLVLSWFTGLFKVLGL